MWQLDSHLGILLSLGAENEDNHRVSALKNVKSSRPKLKN